MIHFPILPNLKYDKHNVQQNSLMVILSPKCLSQPLKIKYPFGSWIIFINL